MNTTSAKSTYRIALDLEGATEDDLARGISAAIKVFRDAKVQPWDAAVASNDIEWAPNMASITEEEGRLHGVYMDAIEAALKAACRDLPNTPKKYNFSLIWDDEEPYQANPNVIERVFPTTEHGRPPEEINATLTEKRRKLVGWNWEWE